jgi:transposase
LGRTTVWLVYAPWRVKCRRCGIRTEQVPWAGHARRFTAPFEELVAYLAQVTDRTRVTELTGIAWTTVGTIVERIVGERLSEERFVWLRAIGVDEFSYRKRHRYVTVVVDHDRRRVVWAGEGRSAEVLGSFFEQLGAERRAAIKWVTIDMAGGYKKAITAWLPAAEIVYDRFHAVTAACRIGLSGREV